MSQKLPRKWLEASWVAEFSSTKQEQGTVTYNTEAIDKADLFLWIRGNRFQQVTPKDFRHALRQLCRDQRPGYKASPLNPVLRKLLVDRIASIGKRLWVCQLNELMSEDAVVTSTTSTVAQLSFEPSIQTHNEVVPLKRKASCSSSALAATLSFEQSLDHTNSWMIEHTPSMYSSSSASESASADELQLSRTHEIHSAAVFAQESRSYVPMQGTSQCTRNVALHTTDIPLDDEILRLGLAEFGFDCLDAKDKREQQQQQQQQQRAAVQSVPYPAFSTMNSLLPQHMRQEHLAEFHRVTALLRHRQMSNVPNRYFTALEQHFTRCFSLPNTMSFSIMTTDRFQTGQPDSYANQQAEQLFSVGLTQVQHVIMGIDCTRKVVACLQEAARLNSELTYVPRIWANTRDEHGNPCPRLVDMWLPRVLFNGTSFMVIIAPHRSVSLEKSFEMFHAPSHPPYIDI